MTTDQPDSAKERRRLLEPDIALGSLRLWVGRSTGATWLDVAVRIADSYERIAEVSGPLLQRPDLKAFEPVLAEFAGVEKGEIRLSSNGGSLAVSLTRYSGEGSTYCKVYLRRFYFEQTISFSVTREHVATALAGLRRVIERLDAAEEPRWHPRPDSVAVDGEEPGVARSLADPTDPAESEAPRPAGEDWDSGLGAGEDIAFTYVVDGFGWFGIEVWAGGRNDGFGGSSWMTDAMGDLLRAGLLLIAGARRAEVVGNAEPGLTRIEFERVLLRRRWSEDGRCRDSDGCWFRIRELDQFTQEPMPVEFEVLCRSPRHVAEALYRMAVPHFEDHARSDYLTLAALEGALAAVKAAEAAEAEGR